MGRCVYCRRPAGVLRKQHAECQERHKRALTMIPELFSKALHSTLPAARFGEMLKEAATASFIKPRSLKLICVSGITSMIDAVLENRLLTAAEDERVTQIKDALGPGIADADELNEKLIKVGMLRELKSGQLPDRVTVAGPFPPELQRQRVMWIFNGVISFRHRANDAAPPQQGTAIVFPATDQDLYCGIRSFVDDPLPAANLIEEANGDLVITDRHLYFIIGDGQRRIPMSKITALQPHSDGIQVTCEQPPGRSRAFSLEDPWLAANLIIGLVKLAKRPANSESDAASSE
jgi:hypothetical protein